MQFPLTGDNYIQIDSKDESLIGMKWNGSEFVPVNKFYYAVLDEKGIVVDVMESDIQMPETKELVAITAEQFADPSLKGKWYNPETKEFQEPPLSVITDYNTDEIQYKKEEKTLSEKLDEMDAAIQAGGGGGEGTLIDAYSKNESDQRFEAKGTAYTKEDSDQRFEAKGTAYTKEESDKRYAPIGSIGGGGGTAETGLSILNKLKDVDGKNSGLDADLLDGKQATDFAEANHTHTEFAPMDHVHTEYANAQEVQNLAAAMGNKAEVEHIHEEYAPVTEVLELRNELGSKAPTDHRHEEYAPANHSHTASQIGAAPANHSHSGYASSGHTHTASQVGAAPASHTHTPASIGASASGHQHKSFEEVFTVYADKSYMANMYPRATGMSIGAYSNRFDSIYLVNAPYTGSDERIKRDVVPADFEKLCSFVDAMEVINYNYKDDPLNTDKRIGILAQQLLGIDPETAKFFVKLDKESGMYSVCAENLVFALLAKVQQLDKEMKQIEK